MGNKNVIESYYMLKDILDGDPNVDQRDDYSRLFHQDIVKGLKLILTNPKLSQNEQLHYIKNTWRIHYRGDTPPPTIQEFLTPEYLGPTASSLRDYVRDSLLYFWDINSERRNLILYPSFGWGKSFMSIISTLYTTAHLILMKDVNKFFGLSKASLVVQALISFTKEKAHELLLQPFIQILESTEKFEKCRTLDSLKKKNKEFGVEKFFYTTANPTTALTFSNNINVKLISNVTNLLGINIISAVFSELAFFSDRGVSDEYIMRMLNDTKGRMFNRFGTNYFARTIIDSSPNSMENKLDKYIVNDAPRDPSNFIIKGSAWDWNFPKFEEAKTTFKIFTGTRNLQPKILTEHDTITDYDTKDIINVPNIDAFRLLFETDLIKALKDHAGIPAGSSNKLISNVEIIESLFVPNLKNIYKGIFAPHTDEPKRLIFDAIKSQFFFKIDENQYEFYRYPQAPRYLSVDQSVSGDNTGICMGHLELDIKTGTELFVVDFSILIEPDKGKINLDSIKYFITDLKTLGRLFIKHVSFDSFQSEPTVQYLERAEVGIEKLSVDVHIAYYLSFISAMSQKKVKMGKNIFMKNNLKSLIVGKTKGGKKKVEHILGQTASSRVDPGDWDTSSLGYYEKDLSDAVAACYTLSQKYPLSDAQWSYNTADEVPVDIEKGQELSRANLNTVLLNKEGFKMG